MANYKEDGVFIFEFHIILLLTIPCHRQNDLQVPRSSTSEKYTSFPNLRLFSSVSSFLFQTIWFPE